MAVVSVCPQDPLQSSRGASRGKWLVAPILWIAVDMLFILQELSGPVTASAMTFFPSALSRVSWLESVAA